MRRFKPQWFDDPKPGSDEEARTAPDRDAPLLFRLGGWWYVIALGAAASPAIVSVLIWALASFLGCSGHAGHTHCPDYLDWLEPALGVATLSGHLTAMTIPLGIGLAAIVLAVAIIHCLIRLLAHVTCSGKDTN